jgi:hypothetical protein
LRQASEGKRGSPENMKKMSPETKKDNWMMPGGDETMDHLKGGSFLPPINAHKPSFISPIHTLSHNEIALTKVDIKESLTLREDNNGPHLQLLTVDDANELDGLGQTVQTNIGEIPSNILDEQPPNA